MERKVAFALWLCAGLQALQLAVMNVLFTAHDLVGQWPLEAAVFLLPLILLRMPEVMPLPAAAGLGRCMSRFAFARARPEIDLAWRSAFFLGVAIAAWVQTRGRGASFKAQGALACCHAAAALA